VQGMKESGKIITLTVKVSLGMRMVMFMKGTGLMAKHMVTVNIKDKMEHFTRDSGKRIFKMETDMKNGFNFEF
jgi:hypothetical protein